MSEGGVAPDSEVVQQPVAEAAKSQEGGVDLAKVKNIFLDRYADGVESSVNMQLWDRNKNYAQRGTPEHERFTAKQAELSVWRQVLGSLGVTQSEIRKIDVKTIEEIKSSQNLQTGRVGQRKR